MTTASHPSLFAVKSSNDSPASGASEEELRRAVDALADIHAAAHELQIAIEKLYLTGDPAHREHAWTALARIVRDAVTAEVAIDG